jgi:dihydroorotate dehydrogenase electron transfer subunit
MIQHNCVVRKVEQVAPNIFALTFVSHPIAMGVSPGQFVNIKPDAGVEPMLRRPFSVYFVDGDELKIIFNVIGKGTAALRWKKPGETIDVLGPLGVPFGLDAVEFDTAILVGGGLGVAPLPLTTRSLKQAGKKIVTYIGARTASMVTPQYLDNVRVATDDGSKGYQGNVVELLTRELEGVAGARLKIFACGPTAMLKALQKLVVERHIRCEASLEGPMGCGFGICQGCPVELVGGEKKYALMCKDGPTFDITKVRL